MNDELIQKYRLCQPKLQRELTNVVRSGHFVYQGHDDQMRLTTKINFLNVLKDALQKGFNFDKYQSEFVVNEAMKKVLYHTNENMLVFHDTRIAQKLVKTTFLLAHHYFRFNLSQL